MSDSAGNLAFAVSRDYTIITGQSSITVSGTVYNPDLDQTANIQQQGPGSLTTNYSGTIKTNREANTIQFLTGSSIDANVNGSWQPLADGSAGAASADYGGKANYTITIIFPVTVTVNFAGRDLVAGLSSGVLPVNGSNQFDLSTTAVAFTSGSIAYRSSLGTPVGSQSVVGEGDTLAGNGSVSAVAQGAQTTETLSLPINSTFEIMDASATIHLTLTGSLVAHSTFATPLPGDYNLSGVVDAADYVTWRKNRGSSTSLPHDTTPGVGPEDYTRWRQNFGSSYQSGAGAESGLAVPEPLSASLTVVAAIAALALTARRRLLRVQEPISTLCRGNRKSSIIS